MIFRNQLIQGHRKQCSLPTIFSLNEAHEKCPHFRESIFTSTCPRVTVFLNSLLWRGSLPLLRRSQRKVHEEGSALPNLGIEPNPAAMPLHNHRMCQGKPLARTLPCRFALAYDVQPSMGCACWLFSDTFNLLYRQCERGSSVVSPGGAVVKPRLITRSFYS
jgi:hypothetical protein